MMIESVTFGAVHLEVTNRKNSLQFYRDIIGLKLRVENENLEMGTDTDMLVVLHPVAKSPRRKGYSGLYHLAIHPQRESEFARVLARLIESRYPISPTDHTASKSIYLDDPDGINIEITLETSERFSKSATKGRKFVMIDANGVEHSPSEPLDIKPLMKVVPADGTHKPLPVGTVIGHIHLYVGNLEKAYDFYKKIGFEDGNYLPELMFADLSAGGVFKHRLAVNTWQGLNVPQPPDGAARMRHFVIKYSSNDKLKVALANIGTAEKSNDGYVVFDPSGTKIILEAEGLT